MKNLNIGILAFAGIIALNCAPAAVTPPEAPVATTETVQT